MSEDSHELKVGQLIQHPEFGEGVMASSPVNGTVSVLFKKGGEKQVEVSGLSFAHDRLDDLFSSIHPATQEEIDRLDLAVEAESIPLMENKTELTSAKIDLLPHQVVLVHKVANANPRRFLIADEVGLGKTIETALVLRELASRGELKRALIIVPASLVENWRRELNDVFHLDFSVFGKEDNGQPSKENPFKTYDRLIGSIDTLKREKRVKMLLESPMWDMIVFDEAHHLTARKNGQNPVITQNYALAAKIQKHCRDMLLLSATPHQGDNERFLELIKLLNPNLFESVQDMKDNRYRLNSVVIRRTKADACTVDGSPLFARRQVYSKEFYLSKDEYSYYNELLDYLEKGYDRDKRKKGKKIGFVMCVFQKIASSSFCALGNAMKNHLVKLLVSTYDRYLETTAGENDDVSEDPKETLYKNAMVPVEDVLDSIKAEAIQVIREVYHLPDGNIGAAIAEQEFYKISRKQKREDDNESEIEESEDEAGFEYYDDEMDENDENEDGEEDDDEYEDEQSALQNLIECLPDSAESKISVLEQALRMIWKESPKEQIIIFATYLGTVNLIEKMLKIVFPDKGVVVLKGGDHEAKINAQNQFKRPNGPQVLVCTAAGREGINLQSAKILFNYDLPWNPMELEQRIGRIHRYGQSQTAQVYNLVAINTLEGKIFQRLKDKIQKIAETLGKVDENGQVVEDFEVQILGFLQENLNYERLYKKALKDRTLKRTDQELDVALKNAMDSRNIVQNLFQDLDGFNLGDYQKCTDNGKNRNRLVSFVEKQAIYSDYQYKAKDDGLSEFKNLKTEETALFTTDRKKALEDESMQLFGIEHPIVEQMLHDATNLPTKGRAVICSSERNGIIIVWKVTAQPGTS
jgi:SNF2 family DNA or RNA helicase